MWPFPLDSVGAEADAEGAAKQAGHLFPMSSVLSVAAALVFCERRDQILLISALNAVIAVVTFLLILDRQQIDLAELAEQVAELLGGTGVTVDVQFGLTVLADPLWLQQMLVNLGTSAQRHGKPPVVISARSAGPGLEISVRDNGIGVPAADRPLLFQRLNRTEGNPESVGLGLWIVRLLAQAHGGDAGHRPASPGSEFVITLPGSPSRQLDPVPADNRAQVPAWTTPFS